MESVCLGIYIYGRDVVDEWVGDGLARSFTRSGFLYADEREFRLWNVRNVRAENADEYSVRV